MQIVVEAVEARDPWSRHGTSVRIKSVGYDPEFWSGLTAGTGLERIAMLKYVLKKSGPSSER
jgi:hypothetical protein